jgi:hypothetical protein
MHEQNDQKTCSLDNGNHDIHLSQSALPMVEFKGWPSIQFHDDNFIKFCCEFPQHLELHTTPPSQ